MEDSSDSQKQANALRMFLLGKHLDFRQDNQPRPLPSFINADPGIQFMIPGSRDAFLNSLIVVNIRDSDMQITITTRRFTFSNEFLSHVLQAVNFVNLQIPFGRYIVCPHPKERNEVCVALNVPVKYPNSVSWYSLSFLNILLGIDQAFRSDAEQFFYPFLRQYALLTSPALGPCFGEHRKATIYDDVRRLISFIGFKNPRCDSADQLKQSRGRQPEPLQPNLLQSLYPIKGVMAGVSSHDLLGLPCSVFPVIIEVSDFFVVLKIVYSHRSELYEVEDVPEGRYEQLLAVLNLLNTYLQRGQLKLVGQPAYIHFEYTLVYHTLGATELKVLVYDALSYMMKKFGEIGGILADAVEDKVIDFAALTISLRGQPQSYSNFKLKSRGSATYNVCKPRNSSLVDLGLDFDMEQSVLQRLQGLSGFQFVHFDQRRGAVLYPQWKGKSMQSLLGSYESTTILQRLLDFLKSSYKAGVLYQPVPFEKVHLSLSHKFESFIYFPDRYLTNAHLVDYDDTQSTSLQGKWLDQIRSFIYCSLTDQGMKGEVHAHWLLPHDAFEPSPEEAGLTAETTLGGLPVEFLDPEQYSTAYYQQMTTLHHPFIIGPLGLLFHDTTYYVVIQAHKRLEEVSLSLAQKLVVLYDVLCTLQYIKMKKSEPALLVPEHIRISDTLRGKLLVTDHITGDVQEWQYPQTEPNNVQHELFNAGLVMYYVMIGEKPYAKLIERFGHEAALRDVVKLHRRPIIPWEFEYAHPKEAALIRELLNFRVRNFEELFELLKKVRESD